MALIGHATSDPSLRCAAPRRPRVKTRTARPHSLFALRALPMKQPTSKPSPTRSKTGRWRAVEEHEVARRPARTRAGRTNIRKGDCGRRQTCPNHYAPTAHESDDRRSASSNWPTASDERTVRPSTRGRTTHPVPQVGKYVRIDQHDVARGSQQVESSPADHTRCRRRIDARESSNPCGFATREGPTSEHAQGTALPGPRLPLNVELGASASPGLIMKSEMNGRGRHLGRRCRPLRCTPRSLPT